MEGDYGRKLEVSFAFLGIRSFLSTFGDTLLLINTILTNLIFFFFYLVIVNILFSVWDKIVHCVALRCTNNKRTWEKNGIIT